MAKTANDYKKMMADCDKEREKLEKKYQKISADAEKPLEVLSNREADKRKAEDKFARNSASKSWLYFLLAGIISLACCVLITLYHTKKAENDTIIKAFTYNIEPVALLILGVVFFMVGIFLCSRKKSVSEKLKAKIQAAENAYHKQAEITDGFARNLAEIKKQMEELDSKKISLKESMYQEFPEEKDIAEREKQAEKEAAIKQLQEREALTLKAEKEAEERQQRILEGQKMFEFPQAYILDGTFDNEFDVFCKAAEYGCPEAQMKVVEVFLGISYKSGVKSDPKKGEELALAFASQGSSFMWELLGKAYLYGEGELTKDEEKGLKYLEKAATKGQQNAMLMAGICHYNGVGTEVNLEKSRLYFSKAAKQGNAQAIQIVDAMDNGEKLRF